MALIISRCVLALVVPRWVSALAVEGEDPWGNGREEVPGEAGEGFADLSSATAEGRPVRAWRGPWKMVGRWELGVPWGAGDGRRGGGPGKN